MQRDRELARAEVGAEVAADLADRVDDVLADLLGDRLELLVGEPVQVLGSVDLVQEIRSSVAPIRDEVRDLLELRGAVWGCLRERGSGTVV